MAARRPWAARRPTGGFATETKPPNKGVKRERKAPKVVPPRSVMRGRAPFQARGPVCASTCKEKDGIGTRVLVGGRRGLSGAAPPAQSSGAAEDRAHGHRRQSEQERPTDEGVYATGRRPGVGATCEALLLDPRQRPAPAQTRPTKARPEKFRLEVSLAPPRHGRR
mmetsp:Transcript_33883/g.97482  ORF Transcript_33883/g.97482 Transcript_33883/m.97482 type:complete len:166 (-) Transcript_33883:233-730(-)